VRLAGEPAFTRPPASCLLPHPHPSRGEPVQAREHVGTYFPFTLFRGAASRSRPKARSAVPSESPVADRIGQRRRRSGLPLAIRGSDTFTVEHRLASGASDCCRGARAQTTPTQAASGLVASGAARWSATMRRTRGEKSIDT
jgi:hypothetical protein